MTTPLLISESPLQVLPRLAAAIGLNDAIVLQQLHYWLSKSRTHHEGKTWVYNSIRQWSDQFPFWSKNTIRRTLERLEERGLIVTAQLSDSRWDHTTYYTIDYQNGLLMSPNWQDQNAQIGNVDLPNLERSSIRQEITQETTAEIHPAKRETRIRAPISLKQIEQLVAEFGDPLRGADTVREMIEEAIGHDSARRFTTDYLAARSWLRRAQQFDTRKEGSSPNGRSHARPDRLRPGESEADFASLARYDDIPRGAPRPGD